ncbi:P-type conjugative transfer protein TrbG [Sphingosinicella sp. LHD-64]|nr:P-type conjugative transfer protein TrbG [Sphingosinicella sp. LHD-64]MDQ8757486.1 P-type conjugative transfer protein TrbG [Sphingosinicella sp. LHD-64]
MPASAPSNPPAELASPAARVAAANRAALREPSLAGYLNAVQVYPYSAGALYRVYAAPERLTDIALQAGETLIAVAAGDTVRWTVGDTSSGSGEGRRTHVLVKPFAAGLRTNLVITTDRRAYHLQLESSAAAAMTAIAWSYPEDALLAVARDHAAASAAPVGSGIAVEQLNFAYRISGDRPGWRPLRAFDDGRQTYVEFPASIAMGEVPPFFVIGAEGEAQLVNYRMAGRYYVVDRVFSVAELRLGTRRQQIVRIERRDRPRAGTGS